jgi:hypothetical protein
MVKLNSRSVLKTIVPRVLKAVLWGSLIYIVAYYLPLIFFPSEIIPFNYASELASFAIIAVFFAVAGALFSGSIVGCGLGVARAIIIIAYFFTVSNSGVINVTLPVAGVPLDFTVNISIILLMIVSVSLLDIVRNLLQALTILTKKSTVPDPI